MKDEHRNIHATLESTGMSLACALIQCATCWHVLAQRELQRWHSGQWWNLTRRLAQLKSSLADLEPIPLSLSQPNLPHMDVRVKSEDSHAHREPYIWPYIWLGPFREKGGIEIKFIIYL